MLALLQPPQIRPPSCWEFARGIARANLPRELDEIIAWADANYRVVTKDGEYFESARSPWLIEPLRMADDPLISNLTFIKPIQLGGTSLGEILLMRWILSGNGLIHYNWPTNEKALDRWKKFTERRLRACHPIRAALPTIYEDAFITFPNIVFAMQGVFTSGNLDSDTVDYIINEEVHQWEAGMLGKAHGRQTRILFPKFINISNAGLRGDQLHQEYNEGTKQNWEVRCPGCSNPHHQANSVYHIMRTRWNEQRPDLGGLRYDSEGCKRDDGTFDYNKLVPTIRYQFPCNYPMRDNLAERRLMAQSGRYSEPTNTGALLSNRSYTLEAVAGHEIRWLDLIQEKHQALRTLKTGDDADWRRYLQERECVFYDPENRPFEGQIVLSPSITKNRDGLPDRACRLAVFDWQQGYKHKGQLIHYWGIIEDVLPDCNSQLVWEGQIASESEMLALLRDFTVEPAHVLIDASKNTKTILQLCYQNGFKAVMLNASHVGLFRDHEDHVPRYYSAGKPIHRELNVPPVYEYQFGARQKNGDVLQVPDGREPLVIMLNLGGLLANHFFIRELKARVIANAKEEKPPREALPHEYLERIIPGDVSEEFKAQYDSWTRVGKDEKKKPGDIASPSAEAFRQVRQDDHMLMCLAYGDMFKDWTFMLGDALANLGLKPETEATDSHG